MEVTLARFPTNKLGGQKRKEQSGGLCQIPGVLVRPSALSPSPNRDLWQSSYEPTELVLVWACCLNYASHAAAPT
jgi:hypothetical protein